jgi:hypothetical protein
MGAPTRMPRAFAGALLVVAASACGGGNTTSHHDGGGQKDGGGRDGTMPLGDSGHDVAVDSFVIHHVDAGGAPYLAALDVTLGATAMVPVFSPETYDYYIRCAAGSNALTVTMTASPGATAALTAPTASPKAAMQTIPVTANEGDLLVAVATNDVGGMTSPTYNVRCLPSDVPDIVMKTYDAGTPGPGYYLIGNASAAQAGELGHAMILDGNGVPVWYSAAPPMMADLAGPVESLKPGEISYIPTPFGGFAPFEVETLSTAPSTTTQLSAEGYTIDQHELRLMKNGHYLALAYPIVLGADLTGLTIPRPGNDAGPIVLGKNEAIADCVILEVDPTMNGKVDWKWSAYANLAPDKTSVTPSTWEGPNSGKLDGGVQVYDVYHCTSLDLDPSNTHILVSLHALDSVALVEYPSGKLLWKMGGNNAGDDAGYISVADPFSYQHDARLLPGWSSTCKGGTGQISLVDDESFSTGKPARAVIYDVVAGGPDGDGGCAEAGGFDGGAPAPGTARVAWQYVNARMSPSSGGGSFRPSPDNKSRVIGWGVAGQPNAVEVDLAGNKLRDITFPYGDVTYRAIKVPLETFDLAMLRANAGK